MKKLRGSFLAKAVAWVVLLLSTVTLVASTVGIVACQTAGIYENRKQDVLQKVYKNIAGRYAYRAMDHRNDSADNKSNNENYFKDTNFRYGVIAASESKLKNLDLNMESTYEYRNFSEVVTDDSYDTFSFEVTDDTEFAYGESIWDLYYYTWDNSVSGDYSYIDDVLYETQSGIFYYRCDKTYYPAKQVTIPVSVTEFNVPATLQLTYVPGERKYQASVQFNQNGEFDQDELKETIQKMTQQGTISLAELKGTPFASSNWTMITLDGIEYDFSNEISHIYASADDMKITESGYKMDDGNNLYLNSGVIPEEYTVLVMTPQEPLKNEGSWKNGDLFVKGKILVNLGYRFCYLFIFVLVMSLVLFLGAFVFLMCAAGHRNDTDEIMLAWIDRVPGDLYAAGIFLIEGLLCAFMVEMSYSLYDSFLCRLGFIGAALIGEMAGMAFLLSVAVRVKTKTLWKNTIIGKILSVVWRFLKKNIERIPMLGKAGIAFYVGLCIVEFLIIAVTGYDPEAEVVFWILGKILLTLFLLKVVYELRKLQDAGKHIAAGEVDYKVDTTKMFPDFKEHGENLNHIGDGISKAVDERMKSERFKTELITNVSHDIKTPLTSIINYVDLLQKEELNNPTAQEYLEVLDRQSSRLKKLIEDLIEASKASTGNLSVQMERCEAGVFLVQTVGEFKEKTDAANLELIIKKPEEPVYIMADGRHFWRIIDNMMNNICKYAQPGTRVYINLEQAFGTLTITFRNTSRAPLNISSEELMERFVRGDSSRNTEGNGLGLNIAKSLTELMQGTFKLIVDGDLFKVVLTFPVAPAPQEPQQPQAPQQPI